MEFRENVLERFRLDGKTAVVTGGAGYIGFFTAMAFAQAGANIAVVDLAGCLEKSREIASGFEEKYGVKAKGYGCELTDEKAVKELFDTIEKDFGSVDIVHNNAGIGGSQTPDIEEWDSEHNMNHLDHWKHVIDVNLTSEYIVAVTAARMMVKENHGGSIINTASLAGQVVNQAPMGKTMDDSSYGVAKAGVLYFTRHFASQVIQYGIRVNSVSPGYLFSKNLHEGMPAEILDCFRKTQPIMRMMEVQELQGKMLYLASDASTYTVGTDMLVDGGHKIW